MKKQLTLSLAFAFIAAVSFAQAKKYVLVEHFTNTYCSSCASNNPGFFQRIAVETNTNVHHIAVHSSVPYSQCPLYQLNTTEQNARRDFYGLNYTPQASLNGAALTSVGSISAASINNAATGTSPIEVKVVETTGTSRTATIAVKTVGTIPTGTYNLYVAVVEKKLNFNAQNGEGVHYNVFRKFLTPATGSAVSLTGTGNVSNFSLPYTVAANWSTDQVHVVAWVQNNTTKEVLNSGTRFDPASTLATTEPSIDQFVQVSPNPTTQKTTVSFTQVTPQYLTVQNAVGQVLESRQLVGNAPVELDFSAYAAGILFVKVQGLEGIAVKRVVKN